VGWDGDNAVVCCCCAAWRLISPYCCLAISSGVSLECVRSCCCCLYVSNYCIGYKPIVSSFISRLSYDSQPAALALAASLSLSNIRITNGLLLDVLPQSRKKPVTLLPALASSSQTPPQSNQASQHQAANASSNCSSTLASLTNNPSPSLTTSRASHICCVHIAPLLLLPLLSSLSRSLHSCCVRRTHCCCRLSLSDCSSSDVPHRVARCVRRSRTAAGFSCAVCALLSASLQQRPRVVQCSFDVEDVSLPVDCAVLSRALQTSELVGRLSSARSPLR